MLTISFYQGWDNGSVPIVTDEQKNKKIMGRDLNKYINKINMLNIYPPVSGRKIFAKIIKCGRVGHTYAAPFEVQQAFVAHG